MLTFTTFYSKVRIINITNIYILTKLLKQVVILKKLQ